jgi:hypothetical protein
VKSANLFQTDPSNFIKYFPRPIVQFSTKPIQSDPNSKMSKPSPHPLFQPARVALAITFLASLAVHSYGAAGTLLTVPPPAEILARLHKEHPRLIASASDFDHLRQQLATQPQLSQWHSKLKDRAQRMLTQPPSRYEIPDGLRLLSTSRRVLDRTCTLALLYRLDGDRAWLDRAWQELDAAAHFTNWNPRHFLDTAEMSHAFAIGYDWLYHAWTPDQRATLRTALLDHGLTPALGVYRGKSPYGSWHKTRHNWNQVCNGGIGIGALAIADEAPELCGEILSNAVHSIQLAMAEFAPDGAWNEGPGYWHYATSYNIAFLAALDSALGTDFGLSQLPAFADTGLFPLYLTGPLRRTINYADGGDGAIRAPQMFWLARKFDRPLYAWYERALAGPAPYDLLWFDPRGDGPKSMHLPLDKYFRGVEVATFRGGWEDPDALFLGFKAGDNKANHSHLDLGSFVLDALGKRWALDLGADDYNLPGYFGKQRWDYYRLRAEGHNTLLINPGAAPDQDTKAAARIIHFESSPEQALAVADLSAAYSKQARRVWRGLSLLSRKSVLVQDEVRTDQPAEVWWSLHTPAETEIHDDGATAMLSQGNVRLLARILTPKNARFTLRDAQPLSSSPQPDGQAKNQGTRKLTIHLSDSTDLRLAVLLTPFRENEPLPTQTPEVQPLSRTVER